MKNMKKLAVISLVVMMMVTAVGYAAFSDDLTVKGTASNAKFDVQFLDASDGAYIDLMVNTAAKGGPVNPGGDKFPPQPPKDGPDYIAVKVTNLIPGQQATATGRIKNFGTVYAYLDGSDTIVKETKYYVMTLKLPTVLGYETEDARIGDFSLTVEMKDYTVKDGIDAGKLEEDAIFELSYRQR